MLNSTVLGTAGFPCWLKPLETGILVPLSEGSISEGRGDIMANGSFLSMYSNIEILGGSVEVPHPSHRIQEMHTFQG